MPGAFRKLQCAALAGLLALGAAASSEAAPAVRQVLVLQSFDRGNLTLDYFTGNFRVDLDQRAGRAFLEVALGAEDLGEDAVDLHGDLAAVDLDR